MSDVWGTAYQLERDRATGNDPDSLRDEIRLLKAALECYSEEQARLRTALIDMLSLAKTISPYALSAGAQDRIGAAERALGAHQQEAPLVHVGMDGAAHSGARSDCSICQQRAPCPWCKEVHEGQCSRLISGGQTD